MIRRKKEKLAKEFIDSEGKKWIQRPAEDLFSSGELGNIIRTIENEKSSGEIVRASIDFRKVNKEYYDAVENLNSELKKKNLLLSKLVSETRKMTDRKNRKLRELIDYIKKLHIFIKSIETENPGVKIEFHQAAPAVPKEIEEVIILNHAEEYFLDENGNEIK